jgi:hypothetical protein
MEDQGMQKKLTISVDAGLYDLLHRIVGRGNISRYIENLLRTNLIENEIEQGYREMAIDTERERDALEWSNSLIGDTNETR